MLTEAHIYKTSKKTEGATIAYTLIDPHDKDLIATLLLSLLKILADSVVSEASVPFVTELKRRMNYEINLMVQLKSESDLRLSFDVRSFLLIIIFSRGPF